MREPANTKRARGRPAFACPGCELADPPARSNGTHRLAGGAVVRYWRCRCGASFSTAETLRGGWSRGPATAPQQGAETPC